MRLFFEILLGGQGECQVVREALSSGSSAAAGLRVSSCFSWFDGLKLTVTLSRTQSNRVKPLRPPARSSGTTKASRERIAGFTG